MKAILLLPICAVFLSLSGWAKSLAVVPSHETLNPKKPSKARRPHAADNKSSMKQGSLLTRRSLINVVSATVVAVTATSPAFAAPRQDPVTLVLMRPGDRLGVELFDVTIGTPPRAVVAVKSSSNKELVPGMVLRTKDNSISTVAQLEARIRSGSESYPIVLQFQDLAAAGDAISDLGTPLVTAQDALDMARQTSSSVATPPGSSSGAPAAYQTTQLRKPSTCTLSSRRNDLLEIVYEARLGGPTGRVYDASAQRGTGRPYQMVLGSGDMLPGVDLGLYDMCPGEIRGLQIPPAVAYGTRGNRLFEIPGNTPLYWQVELVSVQSIREEDAPRTRDELEGRY